MCLYSFVLCFLIVSLLASAVKLDLAHASCCRGAFTDVSNLDDSPDLDVGLLDAQTDIVF